MQLYPVQKYGPPGTKTISEPDSGIANAMNKGIRHSSGELIIHLNAGDEFTDPEVLRTVVASYSDYRWDWAVGACGQLNDRTGFYRLVRVHSFDYEVLRQINFIPHQSTFVAKRVFDTFGLFDESFRVGMDYEFWLRIGQHVKPHILPFLVSRFQLGGISSNTLRGYFQDRRARLINCPEPMLRGLLFEGKQLTLRLGLRIVRGVLTARGYDRFRCSKLYSFLKQRSLRPKHSTLDVVFTVVVERHV